MTKFANFDYLVANNLEVAQRTLENDICYAFGMIDQDPKHEDVQLERVDNSYESNAYIGKRDNHYVLYLMFSNGSDNIALARISTVAFEMQQISALLTEAYLTFYMNYKAKEINENRAYNIVNN